MADNFTVLVVEDDPSTRNVISEVLRDDGIVSDLADGYQSGLEAFAPNKYPIVIIDNQLGDGIGTDLCRQLKEIDPSVTLFLFAGASEQVRLEALSCGVSEVLQKPYDLSKLTYLVKREARRNDIQPGTIDG
ncbi:MAG: response regulator transcription factor [Acidobacteria bacterium]|nr:response regulator transcription factor [Acidobacteriota bacterium]